MSKNDYGTILYVLLRLWMEKILTYEEYCKIMNRVNERFAEEPENGRVDQ